MKHHLLFFIGILISMHSIGQSTLSISKKQTQYITETLENFPENTEFSVAFIKNGQALYYGSKRTAKTVKSVENSDKLYEIGSISKVFTATLLANLVVENKIELDSPVQHYLDFPISNKTITLLQLANHTSGLPRLPSNLDLEKVDQSNPYKTYNEDSLIDYLKHHIVVNHPPGTHYEYSNIGAGLLGYIIQKQTGLTYEALLNRYILTKHGMKNTSTNIKHTRSDLVEGLDSSGRKTSNWDLNVLVGAGGILSNTKDLSAFAMAQFNQKNKALNLTQKPTFSVPEYHLKIGLAWQIIQPNNKYTWHMHNGGTGGYTSIMALDLETQQGIIILSNVSAFHRNARQIDQLCLKLMKNLY